MLTTSPVRYSNPPLPSLAPGTVVEGTMRIAWTQLEVRPQTAPEFIDLTLEATGFVADSPITHGQLVVHSLHTTGAVVVNEREPGLLEDAEQFLSRLAPAGEAYRHDDFTVRTVNMHDDEVANAHAHLQHLTLGSTVQLPVVGGQIALGMWQRIFFVELDHVRARQVLLQLTGI